MMEWEQQQQVNGSAQQDDCAHGNGVPYVKVMTDEQLEILRKQIAIYASICDQLIEMHRTLTAQQDLAGVGLGNLYCDSLVSAAGHKITARQRWTPTPVQLQILERIFNQGNGTPSKQKIKDIASELSQHGQISESNVYNWFQNRRARSKRKLQNATSSNAESEVETEVESRSPKDEKENQENIHSQQIESPMMTNLSFHSPVSSSELQFVGSPITKVESMFLSGGGSIPGSQNLGQISFYNGILSDSENEHLNGKMEFQGGYDLY